MKIRNATEKDIPGIVALGNRFLKEIPTWGLVIRTEDELRQMEKRFIWVVEENGKLIGHAICLPRKNDGSCIFEKKDKILELDEIYLVPESRGQGVGSELLEVIENHAKAAGFTRLFVDSSVKDLMPVLRFYRDNGLKTWSVQLFKELE
jgi:N-acetylglutamate synthase-like GNAT family acetyltransferase